MSDIINIPLIDTLQKCLEQSIERMNDMQMAEQQGYYNAEEAAKQIALKEEIQRAITSVLSTAKGE